MRRGLVVLLFAAVVACVLGSPRASRAQAATSAPQIQLQASADTVGVGDVLNLEMSAQSGDDMPADPRLGSTPGFSVVGQNASPTQTHISINGNRIDRYGLTVDWALQAQRVGSFTLGPPSVSVGGQRFAGRAMTVHVVPAGQAPRQRAQQRPSSPFPPGSPFSAFDPWKQLFPNLDHDDSQSSPWAPPVATDPKLSLDAPRGAYYFLHATIDKTSAVVGEQVTFSVYEYLDRDAERLVDVDESDVHDATVADFAKHALLAEDRDVPLLGYAAIGGHTWRVTLLRRWALFPLRAGDLTIGPMSVMLVRPRGQAGPRTTETFHVHVSEPPAAGRPPGYALGDVGRFSLAAQVNPREIDQDGAVGVHVELSGTGNVPSALVPPAREGVEWLAPEVHEQLGSVGKDSFGGKRTFDFVVRVHRAGDVALGDLALPFWDPDRKAYDVARAPLGTVHVKASATAAASADPARETLPGLPPPRDALQGPRASRAHADDSPVFWLAGIGAWPLAFGVAVAGRAAGRRAAGAWRARRASPASELRERVAAAGAACEGGDARAADAAIARALEAATVAHRGVSIRGALGDEVVARLAGAGVDREAAGRVADLLRDCEAARFSPEAADVAAARERWARAQGAIRQLERR